MAKKSKKAAKKKSAKKKSTKKQTKPINGDYQKTDKRYRDFARYYVLGVNGADPKNGTQAAIAAGYSKSSAASKGSQLLTNVKVQQHIKEEEELLAAKMDVRREEIVQEFKNIGFSDLTNLISFSEDGVVIKDSAELPDEVKRSISKIKVHEREHYSADGGYLGITRNIEFQLHNKLGALDSLAKIKGMFKEQGGGGTAVLVLKGLNGQA